MTQQKFKKQYTLQERIQKSLLFKQKYSDHVLLILEEVEKRNLKDPQQQVPLKSLQKNKFIVSKKERITILYNLLRRKLEIGEKETLFLYINNNVISQHNTVFEEFEQKYRDEDGFVYIQYTNQETTG